MGKSAVDSLFSRYVEPGRLAYVRYGPLSGKMVVIVDMVDIKRVVVDGPTTGVTRQVLPTKWIALTGQRCNIERGAREKTLKKALAADSTLAKWSQTQWAKKIAARNAKKNLNDFERFSLMLARKKVARGVKQATKVKKGKQ